MTPFIPILVLGVAVVVVCYLAVLIRGCGRRRFAASRTAATDLEKNQWSNKILASRISESKIDTPAPSYLSAHPTTRQQGFDISGLSPPPLALNTGRADNAGRLRVELESLRYERNLSQQRVQREHDDQPGGITGADSTEERRLKEELERLTRENETMRFQMQQLSDTAVVSEGNELPPYTLRRQ